MPTLKNKQKAAQDKVEARETLAKLCPKGATIYTLVRHVARSGMSRNIDFYVIAEGELCRITYSLALLTGHRLNKKDYTIVREGCGMDMCTDTVYDLARELFGSPYAETDPVTGRSHGEALKTRTL